MKKAITLLLAFSLITALTGCAPKMKEDITTTEQSTTVKAVKSDDIIVSEFEAQSSKEVKENKETDSMTVQEISDGVSTIALTTKVKAGEMCSLSVMGTPKKEFSVTVTDLNSNKVEFGNAINKKSDAGGFVSWGFSVPENTEKGLKIIIIREEGTANYMQTSVTVY